MAVIAPGTGLGKAFLVRRNKHLLPVASEGGHVDFAPRNRQQLALLDFLWQREEHVSVEKVCSGIGLVNIHDFFTSSLDAEDPAVTSTAPDERTPIIVQTALTALQAGNSSHISLRTVALFWEILAAEAANLALDVLATGGIYIGGGLCPRMLSVCVKDRFMDIFVRGVYREMLSDIPVYIILNPKTALLGAAACGLELKRQ